MDITLENAQKILNTIDAGLVRGLGQPIPGLMCIEAAVCYGLGLDHSDDPVCVSPVLRVLKIKLNDSAWSSSKVRAKGLRRLGLAQLGSTGILNDKEFASRVAKSVIQKQLPIALRAIAKIQKNDVSKNNLIGAANKCEVEGTYEAALEAKSAAAAYAYAYAAAYAAADAAAYAAAADAAYAAAYAAYAAAYAAADAARDKVLSDFAEDVVGILIEMKAPGCQWLYLTEVN